MTSPTPTDEDKEELLLSCRYGDLDDVKNFVEKHGSNSLADLRDDNANTALHMVCANGHLDILEYLLPMIPSSLFAAQNQAGSTPLHWAAVNSHIACVQKLVQFPGGPGVDLIDIKNGAGRSPLAEAELAGWEEGAKWLVEMMRLDVYVKMEENEVEGEDTMDGDHDVEIEVQDADGQVAKMTINQ